MGNKTKQGNTMVIVIVVVVAVAIVGYLIYNNNQQKQAEAEAQIQAAEQQAMAAEKEAMEAQAAAQKAEQEAAEAQAQVAAKKTAAQETATTNAAATCQENLERAQTNLPKMEDYAKLLENLGEQIDDNPDDAVEKCREIYEDRGLSKNECQIKVDEYVAGKTAVYDDLQTEIEAAEELIAEGC